MRQISISLGIGGRRRGGPVFYADPTATGAGDGSTWEDAFTDLPTAIAALPDGAILRTNSTEDSPFPAPDSAIVAAPSNIRWQTASGLDGETWISGARRGVWTDEGGGVFSIAMAAAPHTVAYDFKRDDITGTITGVDLTIPKYAAALEQWGANPEDLVGWYGGLKPSTTLATATPAEGFWGYTGGRLYINPPGSPTLADVNEKAIWSDGVAGLAIYAAINGWRISGKMTVFFTPSDVEAAGYSLRFTAASNLVVEDVRSIMSGYHSVCPAGTSGPNNIIRRCTTIGYSAGGIPYTFYTSAGDLTVSGHRGEDCIVIAAPFATGSGAPVSTLFNVISCYSHTDTLRRLSGLVWSRILQLDFVRQIEIKHGITMTGGFNFVSAGDTGDTLDQTNEDSFGVKVDDSMALGVRAAPRGNISHRRCTFDRMGYTTTTLDLFSAVTASPSPAWHWRTVGCKLRLGGIRYWWAQFAADDSAWLEDCDILLQSTYDVGSMFQPTVADSGLITLKDNRIDAAATGAALITVSNPVWTANAYSPIQSLGGNRYGINVSAPVKHTNVAVTPKTMAQFLAATNTTGTDVGFLTDLALVP